MANHKSAIKRIRQTERRTAVNRNSKGRLRRQVKALLKSLDGKGGDPKELLNPTISVIDRSVQKGVIKKGKADRMKSRLTRKANKTGGGQAAA